MSFAKYLRQLGKNLRHARQRTGMRQMDVHVASGLTYRHYQRIEAGEVNVTIETLYRLAKLYNAKIEDLVKDGSA